MQKPIIGVLMLDTSFYRPKGDIGNPSTFGFPVDYEMVSHATIDRVVKKKDRAVVGPFVEKAKQMEKRGIKAITTSCGFLALFQQEIQQQLRVPFFSSSLLQIPLAHALTGGTVGVLTARKASLTDQHLKSVKVTDDPFVIAGMDNSPAFTAAIVEETAILDQVTIAKEMKKVTMDLLTQHPAITAIVLECTNMPPYKYAIREVTDLPIFDSNTLVRYLYESFKVK
ncbi:aspartate/glutamate racemase family protein [Oceanobacillus halotolerans]|uniref:aspartate/glutamate racemase family protein n=1 Tax=Oceanobacillus halotolerans TaxID=2663380 RepID=UPI0013DC9265|nr:aspartate/glutamate racemase family protein [Oceanobacillus halotolerans]